MNIEPNPPPRAKAMSARKWLAKNDPDYKKTLRKERRKRLRSNRSSRLHALR